MSRETDNEMKQIQKGLEAFLQQELQEMEVEGMQRNTEPQLYTIGEEEEPERELDIIGSTSGRKKTPVKKREREDYYIEDWDSPGRSEATGQGRRRSREAAVRSRAGQGKQTSTGRRSASRDQNTSARSRTGQNQGAASGRRTSQRPVTASKRVQGPTQENASRRRVRCLL